MQDKELSVKMAVLETKLKNLDDKVSLIQADIKAIAQTLSRQTSLELEISSLKSDIEDLKRTSNLWKWLAPTLTGLVTAIFSSLMTFLIINYLSNAH